jgi:hypothetical protein
MVSNKSANDSSRRSSRSQNTEFWQQLEKDFSFEGVDEELLRQHTEQWITCASELLGPPPSRVKNKTKH